MSGSGGAVSAAVITLGLISGLMLAGPSLDSALSDLKDARQGATDELIAIKGTSFKVPSIKLNTTSDVLRISVRNTGSTVIGLAELGVLLNGTMTPFQRPGGDHLYPGAIWELVIKDVPGPCTVRVVGPWGISAQTDEVELER